MAMRTRPRAVRGSATRPCRLSICGAAAVKARLNSLAAVPADAKARGAHPIWVARRRLRGAGRGG